MMMADGLNRFLGDTPMRTIIKLVILCVVVGFIMSTFGLSPMDVLYWVRKTFLDLWRSGFATLGKVGNYMLLGAAIVIPLFIILRILNWRKS
jgi:ABC-type proline/glycine betaine transport system permease subunit